MVKREYDLFQRESLSGIVWSHFCMVHMDHSVKWVLEYTSTVWCRYNAVKLLSNHYNKKHHSLPRGKLWCFCCEYKLWFIFYLHFMSFLHIDMAQVVEILSPAKQELAYFT